MFDGHSKVSKKWEDSPVDQEEAVCEEAVSTTKIVYAGK
jgi:hypothetical protein